MNAGRTVFAQIMDFLPRNAFRRCIARYGGQRKVQRFSCMDQFLCMAFAQLSYRESLRDIEACLRAVETVSHGHSRHHRTINAGLCQRDSRLAYLRRLCSGADPYRANALCQRRLGRRTGQYGVRSGFNDRRSVPVPFPVGQVSQTQSGGKNAHTVRLARQHSHIYTHFRRPIARCEHSRRDRRRGGFVLHHGSRLSRLCSTLQTWPVPSILCNASKKQLPFSTHVFPSGGQIDRSYVRPDDTAVGFLCGQGLPRQTPTNPLCGSRNRQDTGVPDQLLYLRGIGNSDIIQMPMAGGTVLQMDQAALEDQSVFRHIRECRQDTNMDRCVDICDGGDNQKTAQVGTESLHNSTDFERNAFRESFYFTSTYGIRLQNRDRRIT